MALIVSNGLFFDIKKVYFLNIVYLCRQNQKTILRDMAQNLVIVESPAKAKTIEKFLGKDYTVMSSYGHIRDLKKKTFSINTTNFQPQYEIPTDKTKVVSELKMKAKQSDMVWLASDEDREGEAISWHLQEVLKLKPERTRRIVFHEITKMAILNAIEHPRTVDMALVNAQQARRVLDRIVGFKLSPVLWRKVKPGLSAGRVQSVAVRLIVEREREIQAFQSEASYRVTAVMQTQNGGEIKAELNRRFATRSEAEAFLKDVAKAKLTITDLQTKPVHRTPAPPFTTSTLQQEAAHKLGFPVAQTMLVAQHLYENGLITYMRTDSVNLSSLALGTSRDVITELMGKEYVKTRQYQTASKGAQEAHEAIRPTYMSRTELSTDNVQERRLYDLIWKRTVASQMADAEMEKTTATISICGREEQFVATGEVVKFDGFLKVYRDTEGDEENSDTLNGGEGATILPPMTVGQDLTRIEIQATERFTLHPARYNEASLVKKLEELGIGRPSTYAPTISTIQQREYVVRGDKAGVEQPYDVLTMDDNGIRSERRTMVLGAERARLIPTDTGLVVTEFLQKAFPTIMDYNFTAEVEKEFDSIAEGKEQWDGMIRHFYEEFEPRVEEVSNTKTELRTGERVLGKDPKTGKTVSVKIGRYGPVVQIGVAGDDDKPLFAQLRKGQSIESLTLEEALDLFKLPRNLGDYDGDSVIVGTGRFGYYVLNQQKYVSIPKDQDPLTISLEEAIELINQKREEEQQRHLKTFAEDAELEVMNGRYGPYVAYKGENYRLPKVMHSKAAELTYEQCMEIVQQQATKAKSTSKRSYARRK